MEKAEIVALLAAHGGRAQVVASLHLLRERVLGEPAHAFLAEHEAQLATIDLQRWLTRAAEHQRPAVEAAMARLAEKEPARFEHEIRRAEAAGLAEPPVIAPAPDAAAAGLGGEIGGSEGFFDPGEMLADFDFDAAGGPGPDRPSPPGLADAGGAAGELFGDLFAGDAFGEGASRAASPHPALDGLLAGLAAETGSGDRAASRRRPGAAWKAKALSAAEDTAESWAAAVIHLPPAMRDAVLVRAAVSPRSEERAALLEWLFQNGARRPKLVELTLSLLGMREAAANVSSWLAETWIPKLLPDKAAWNKHGPALLTAFLAQGHFSALDELFTAVLTGAAALGPGLLGMAGPDVDAVRGPVVAAFSKALLLVTADALAAGRQREALGAAAALVSLRPPSREIPAVRSLRRKKSAKGEVATLLALAERRARRPKETPGLEDVIATVHVLSDAIG